MNEEELFCKLFPEYAVNGKPLSSYFDLFESGYEQAEKRIADLEKENAELKEELEEADNATDCFNRQEEIIAKAKEIIKTILGFMQTFGYSPSMDKFVTEAEQFLKE